VPPSKLRQTLGGGQELISADGLHPVRQVPSAQAPLVQASVTQVGQSAEVALA
jgi:hypothetical protein